jgi:hypothetical protein
MIPDGLIELPASVKTDDLWGQVWWLLFRYYEQQGERPDTWKIAGMCDEVVKQVQA